MKNSALSLSTKPIRGVHHAGNSSRLADVSQSHLHRNTTRPEHHALYAPRNKEKRRITTMYPIHPVPTPSNSVPGCYTIHAPNPVMIHSILPLHASLRASSKVHYFSLPACSEALPAQYVQPSYTPFKPSATKTLPNKPFHIPVEQP